MNIYLALGGVFIGALIFAATLNAGYRAWMAGGGLSWTQGIACGVTILIMLCLSIDLPAAAKALAHALTLVSMANVIMEKGWHRALPLVHFAVGMTLAADAAPMLAP